MLTIRMLPTLSKIVGKLDAKPIIEILKAEDIFTEGEKNFTNEQMGIIGADIIAAILPQLGRIADDLPALAAVYKGMTLEEVKDLDAADFINELVNDEGIRTFFARALRRKAEQAL